MSKSPIKWFRHPSVAKLEEAVTARLIELSAICSEHEGVNSYSHIVTDDNIWFQPAIQLFFNGIDSREESEIHRLYALGDHDRNFIKRTAARDDADQINNEIQLRISISAHAAEHIDPTTKPKLKSIPYTVSDDIQSRMAERFNEFSAVDAACEAFNALPLAERAAALETDSTLITSNSATSHDEIATQPHLDYTDHMNTLLHAMTQMRIINEANGFSEANAIEMVHDAVMQNLRVIGVRF